MAGRTKKFLSREDIERAMRNTLTNRAAARFCRCSYTHYKKYASSYLDPETGKTLYELHLNRGGKGIPKFPMNAPRIPGTRRKKKEPALLDIIEGRGPVEYYTPQKLKYKLLEAGYLKSKCYRCGFKEKRLVDRKMPLILKHKNGDKKDFRLDNLELLCYNCAFLEGGVDVPITEQMVEKAEEYLDVEGWNKRTRSEIFELDEYQQEWLNNLGLSEKDEPKPGSEYIARL